MRCDRTTTRKLLREKGNLWWASSWRSDATFVCAIMPPKRTRSPLSSVAYWTCSLEKQWLGGSARNCQLLGKSWRQKIAVAPLSTWRRHVAADRSVAALIRHANRPDVYLNRDTMSSAMLWPDSNEVTVDIGYGEKVSETLLPCLNVKLSMDDNITKSLC